MSRTLQGKCVVVTGAGTGIGAGVARLLIAGGARVALLGRTKETLDRVRADTAGQPGMGVAWPCDVGDPGQVNSVIADVTRSLGEVDVLINNAGVIDLKPLPDYNLEDMRKIYDTNAFGVFNCTHAVLPTFLRRGRGHIITVASGTALVGLPLYTAYADSKAAAARMSEVWRRELHSKNIRVTTVFNYYTATKMVFPESGPDPVVLRLPFLPPLQKVDTVARAIVRAIERPKAEVWVPRYLRLMMALWILVPELGDFLLPAFPRGKPVHWRLEQPEGLLAERLRHVDPPSRRRNQPSAGFRGP